MTDKTNLPPINPARIMWTADLSGHLAHASQTRRVRWKTGLPEHLARDVAAIAFGGAR